MGGRDTSHYVRALEWARRICEYWPCTLFLLARLSEEGLPDPRNWLFKGGVLHVPRMPKALDGGIGGPVKHRLDRLL